ncbi:MAG: hypothetical protein MUF38_14460 [Anaerolineae bacterium]|jgi:hypothetical protein|nr:hypothetical protein [Anaerolineae bacterium]
MSKRLLTDALGLPPNHEIFITDLQFVQWGRDVIFSCECHTSVSNPPTHFRLVFTDTREMRWKTYAHTESGLSVPTSELVEFAPGQKNHHRDAAMLTAHFSVTLSYGSLTLETRTSRIIL